MRNGSDWVAHIQVLHIYGRWVISHPDFSEILDIFAKLGQLKSFLREVKCSSNCIHWYKFSEGLRTSVEGILSPQKLTSIGLHGICAQFPMEIVEASPLRHLGITGDQGLRWAPIPRRKKEQLELPSTPTLEPAEVKAQVEYLHLRGSSAIMCYYNERPDSCLDFSQFEELSFKDTLGFPVTVLEIASRSLTHLSWTYKGKSREYSSPTITNTANDFPVRHTRFSVEAASQPPSYKR